MRARDRWLLTLALGVLLVGPLGIEPPPGRADVGPHGEEHEEEVGVHLHVPAPLAYADAHIPPGVWTAPAMLARGQAIYAAKCAVCHGDAGDGKGPAGLALPLKPPDLRDRHAVAEMRDNYWFWRVSEGGLVEPFKSWGSAMPAFKDDLTVADRWAVIAYQHTFSGHHGPHVPWEHPEMVQVGRDIFAMACVACHGDSGRGDGTVGAMLSPRRAPQPRDFTGNEFKLRSTPSGQLPTTADLFRTITEGIPGGGSALTFGLRRHRIMPSFGHMPEAQRLEVVEFVKSLNPAFWERRAIETVAIPPVPALTPERLARGRQLYRDAECWQCHGEHGRGDGPSAPELRDNAGLWISPTDLTRPRRFKNGATPQDLYRTLMTGLLGTPMPSYADALEPDQAWDLVFYVLSLSEEGRLATAPAQERRLAPPSPHGAPGHH
jgi:cytochrome c oxidase cbb3-type subunit 2